MKFIRPVIVFIGIIILWQLIVSLTGVAPFILPSPVDVLTITVERIDILMGHAKITIIEILLGLIFGTIFGAISALIMSYYRPARSWLLPVLVVTQAIPVFALAPILVLWLGYGLLPKVVMATLII